MSKQLTANQQADAVRLMPLAKQIAKGYGKRREREEYTLEALSALCVAVMEYKPVEGSTIEDFVTVCIRNALLKFKGQ